MFSLLFFSLYSEEINSSFLDAHPPHPTPAPSHPSFFKSKIVNPFQTCQRTDTFCQIQSSSSLLLKNKDNNTKRTTSISYFWGSRTSPPWRILGSLLICNIIWTVQLYRTSANKSFWALEKATMTIAILNRRLLLA